MAKKMSQSDRKKLMIAISAMALVVVALVLVTLFSRRGEKVPSNPEGTVGNIAGNINNGGIVCESDGRIYFSNPYDGGALYSMNTDETDCKKISTAVASSICVAGNYIYYFQSGSSGASGLGGVRVPNSFIRSHIDGQHGYTMSRDVVVRAQVVGDYVYMEGTADNNHNYPYFQRMPIGGGDAELLARYGINPSCAVGNIIYYNNTESNHYLMAYNTVTKNTYEVLEGNIWNPVYDNGYIYYMAPADGYQLRRYSLNDQTIEILTNEKVESFNVYRGYIYYQTFGDTAYLAFMNTDGSGSTIVAYGNYNSISMTSNYIYFKDYWNETSLYHTRYGTTYYEPVNAALQAALENIVENEKSKEE
ncbi:MAG: DUF5050 domain-containing protein [Lachnospiraceae bacterium]|nr:DUF5050 domain-containing protein [Lachnospiraceae bacterium]